MISFEKFSSRVREAEKNVSIVELPEDVLQMVVGGDFREIFNDNYSDGIVIGPTFRDNFSEAIVPKDQ